MNQFDEIYKVFKQKFNAWIDGFQERGSGYTYNKILQTEVSIAKVKSLAGSSYFDLHFTSNCIVNIKNDDNKYFLWCIISAILKPTKNPQRVTQYLKMNVTREELSTP